MCKASRLVFHMSVGVGLTGRPRTNGVELGGLAILIHIERTGHLARVFPWFLDAPRISTKLQTMKSFSTRFFTKQGQETGVLASESYKARRWWNRARGTLLF